MAGMFRIRFGGTPASWLGNGWRPYASKRSAVTFPTKEAAETRLAGVRKVFDANPQWNRELIDGAVIVAG